LEVEFEMEKEESGKLKAINVTAPGGKPLEPPPRIRNRRKPKNGGGGTKATRSKKKKEPAAPAVPPFHDKILSEVKEKIVKQRQIELEKKSTVDIATGDLRIKLGRGGYCGLAKGPDALVAEGTYDCDENGKITFKWERCLVITDGQWKPGKTDGLIASLSLTEGMFCEN
jgi:hypothetical protein